MLIVGMVIQVHLFNLVVRVFKLVGVLIVCEFLLCILGNFLEFSILHVYQEFLLIFSEF